MIRQLLLFTLLLFGAGLSGTLKAQSNEVSHLLQPDSSRTARDSSNFALLTTSKGGTTTTDTVLEIAPKPKPKRRLELPKGVADVTIDTNKVSRIFKYTVNRSNNNLRAVEIDTSLEYYYVDYPFHRADVGAIFLGQPGTPVTLFDYFKRDNATDLLFMRPYTVYFYTPDNVPHYQTTTPYSLLYYNWTSPRRAEEMQLRILHTQNINHRWSYGFEFNNISPIGQYQRQHTRNRGLNFFTSYLGEYYQINAGYIRNWVEMQENGGILRDSSITDSINEPEMIPISLSKAKNQFLTSTWYVTHSLDLPLIHIGNDSVIYNIVNTRLGHTFEYSTHGRVYQDLGDSAYYDNIYENKNITRDSVGLTKLENRFFLELHPLRAFIFESLAGGLGYRAYQAFNPDPSMYLEGITSTSFHSMFTYASMSAWYKKYFQWNAYAESVLSGFNSGDYLLQGGLRLSAYPWSKAMHLDAKFTLSNTTPDYFIQHFYSNHYVWNNSNFAKTTEMRLEGMLSIPSINTQIGIKQSVLNAPIYFGYDALPAQQNSTVSITAFTLDNHLQLGPLHFNHRILGQLSSDPTVVSVPKLALNAQYYLELVLVPNVLTGRLGIDTYYSTSFRGYGYNPATGMFYNSPIELGNYPWIDAFVAFRWKRATPFIKLEHANHNLFDIPNNYFSAVHHPRNPRTIKFGLSWKFFD